MIQSQRDTESEGAESESVGHRVRGIQGQSVGQRQSQRYTESEGCRAKGIQSQRGTESKG